MPADAPSSLLALRRDVRSLVEEWRAAGRFQPTCDAWLRSFDADFSRTLGDRGWLGITWPVEFGGSARSNRARLIVTEELLRAGAPVAAHWIGERQIGPAILRHGSARLQQLYLPQIARGVVTFCLGMSETESGSDLASVRTEAVRTDDGWQITGRKIWTSQAHRATHAYVLARTSRGGAKQEGLTEFIVDMSAPGVEVRPIYDLSGEHHFNEVTFDGVPVPADHVLGDVGHGWRQVTEQLSFERGGLERVLSTYPLLASVLDLVERKDVSPDVSAKLGKALARLGALRGLAWRIAVAMDEGQAPVFQAAVLKDLGTAFEGDVNELARLVIDEEADPEADGISGLLAQGILAAPGFTIRGGTTEVLRTIIARSGPDPVQRGPQHAELRALVGDVLAGKGGDPVAGLSAAWETVEGLDWPLIGIPEEQGGAGGTLHDLVGVAEGVGRQVTPLPLLEAAVAARLLTAAGRPANGELVCVVLPAVDEQLVVSGSGPARSLTGAASRVPWASRARSLAVCARDDRGDEVTVLVPADAPGVDCRSATNIAAEPRDAVSFRGVVVTDDMLLSQAPSQRKIRALAGLLRSAAIVGALERAHDLSRQHVSQREQFGRPLISFQAVAHGLAAQMSQMSLARAAVEDAVQALESDDEALERVAVACVVAGSAATEVSRIAHQLHGAMGVTREYPLHLATRRLWSWRDEWGTERQWSVRLGEHLLPQGSERVWRWLSDNHEGSEISHEQGRA
jgi:alkylation response protein AidB-like acyl-CoA dehydrogenase